MTSIVGVGDFRHNGRNDIAGIDTSGNPWLWDGDGKGSYLPIRHLPAKSLGRSWQLPSVGDLDADRNNDVYAVDGPSLNLYSGTGRGRVTRSGYWEQDFTIDAREPLL